MDLTIDARGDKCPVPVVKAKKALASIEGEGSVLLLVDNETCVHNLESLAKAQKCTFASTQTGEDAYEVTLGKTAESIAAQAECSSVMRAGEPVVVISSATMGDGDDTLGGNLMKAFIFALTQQDVLPKSVLFYKGGVHLTCEGSPALDDLKALADAGVEIMSAALASSSTVSRISLSWAKPRNMYVIVESSSRPAWSCAVAGMSIDVISIKHHREEPPEVAEALRRPSEVRRCGTGRARCRP